MTKDDFYLGLLSEPGGRSPTSQFTTLTGEPIDFYGDGKGLPIKVTEGEFSDLNIDYVLAHLAEYFSNECVKGASKISLEEVSLRDLGGNRDNVPFPTPKPKTLAEKFTEGRTTEVPSTDRRPNEKPSNTTAKPADKDPKGSPPLVIAPKEVEPRSVGAVCAIDKRSISVAAGTALRSPQTVGLRNSHGEAEGFDYLSAGSDAIPLGANVDIADSSGKLVPYEPVASVPGDLLVALSGIDETRLRAKAEAPAKLLRLVIVGGAPEVAISGLDLVGTQLNKQALGRIRIDAEWYGVQPSGSIALVGAYDSLNKLVKAAAEKAAGRNPDVLDEAAVLNLLDGFESVLLAKRQPVEKVFWIKGAYSVPSSAPQRFEKFITSISASPTVARTTSGVPLKWFVLVSARTSGFSINYLKEPIYAQQIGDVIEEDPDGPRSGARQLIGDVALLATRLQIASVPLAAGTSSNVHTGPTGKLVLNASDIFDSRGYALSAEAILTLPEHLRHVARLLSRAEPTSGDLSDAIQNRDDGNYPRIPKAIPDWAHKAIRDLNEAERHDALSFVERYLIGADALANEISRLADRKDDLRCSLFYVPEGSFGFGKH